MAGILIFWAQKKPRTQFAYVAIDKSTISQQNNGCQQLYNYGMDASQVGLSLASGFVGSVIGALATVWATNATINATARQTREADEKRMQDEKKDREEVMCNWIKAEIIQISQIIKNTPPGFQRLPTSGWETNKKYLFLWTVKEQAALINFYNEVGLFNTYADQYVHIGNHPMMNMPWQLTAARQRVMPVLTIVLAELKISVS
jgi:hypothetical protein